MREKLKKTIKYLLSLAVAAVLLYFSFRGVKWENFVEGLRSCRWGFVLLSMLFGLFSFWVRGVRWRRLLLPFDGNLRRISCFNAVNIGYIANFVFPRIGEFVRCGVITKNSKTSYDKVLGTVVLERAWDLLMLLLLLLVLLVAKWNKFGDFFVNQIWAPSASALSFSLWWILAVMLVLGVLSIWLIWFWREKNKFCAKIWAIVVGICQGVASCLKMKDKWAFIFDSLLIWAIYWLMACATMWAVPLLDGLTVVDALFLSLAGSIGWVVPVPGGFGAFHFIVALALQTIYGIPFETGIIFATLSHEAQAITMVLSGGASYAYEALRKR